MSRRCVCLWLTMAMFIGSAPAPAQPKEIAPAGTAGLTIESLRLGFDGIYKVGHWTPLAITLQSSREVELSGELVVEVVDGDNVSTLVRESQVNVAPGKSTMVRMLVKPGRPQAPIKVRFESQGEVVERTFADDEIPGALLATQELFLEIGRPIGLARLRQGQAESSLERPAAALVKDRSDLPLNHLGYDGVDLLALTTSDADMLWSGNSPELDAIDQWVRLGGKLILCVGRNGMKLGQQSDPANQRDSPLSRLVPGKVERVITRLQPGAWESHAVSTAEPMVAADGGRAEPIPLTLLTDVQGRVELSDGGVPDVPLVIRTPYGLGEVLFVAADLDQPPFADWSARTKLLMRLLGRSNLPRDTSAARETNVQGIRLGYTGLSGQLRAALGQYAGARMAPFWLVFVLALGYAVAVFPLEYAVARWLRPRFEAAWVLLPLVLAASAIGMWYIAMRWKGNETLVNKIEVVDVDLPSGTVRGHAWLGVYSPREDAYDLQIAPADHAMKSIGQPQLSWLGLAGTGLGGMNSQIGALEQFERGYGFDRGGSLADVPLAARSSKSFEASWTTSIAVSSARLGERTTTDRQPLGRIKNDTGLALHDGVLLYDGWSYDLGTLEPGASVEVGSNPRLLTAKSYLTDRRTVGDKEQATPYEPDGADMPRIVRAMLFHEAAGARQYTSLSNRIYDRMDLSGQLRLGRAVLLATGPPATRVSIEGQQSNAPKTEQELALYRFVIPVDRSGTTVGQSPTVELRLQ